MLDRRFIFVISGLVLCVGAIMFPLLLVKWGAVHLATSNGAVVGLLALSSLLGAIPGAFLWFLCAKSEKSDV